MKILSPDFKTEKFFYTLILCLAGVIHCFGIKTTYARSQTSFISEGQEVVVEHLSRSWDADLGVLWGFDFLPSEGSDEKKPPQLIVSERGGKLYLLSLANGEKKTNQRFTCNCGGRARGSDGCQATSSIFRKQMGLSFLCFSLPKGAGNNCS